MPQVIIPLVSAIYTGVQVYGVWGAMAAVVAGVVVGASMYVSMTDTPDASGAPSTAVSSDVGRGLLLNRISNVAPVNVVYGARRVGGTPIFRSVTGNTNKRLHMLMVFSEGPVQGFQNVYFNQQPVAFDKETIQRDVMVFRGVIDRSFTFRVKLVEASGVAGIYADRLDRIADRYHADGGSYAPLAQDEPQGVIIDSWYDGTLEFFPFDVADIGPHDTITVSVTDMTEGARYRISKYPTAANNWTMTVTLYDHGAPGPAQNKFVFSALLRKRDEPAPDHSSEDEDYLLNLSGLDLADYTSQSRYTALGNMVRMNQEKVPDPSYSTASEIYTILGNQYLGNQQSARDEEVIELLRRRFPGEIPDTSEFPRLSMLYVVLDYDTEVYRGLPQVTADMLGRLVKDPRDGVTRFTQNPKLMSLDYLTDSLYGKGVPEADIDIQSFIDDANYCDELVSVDDDVGQQPRYVAGGVVNIDRTLKDNLSDIQTACRGAVLWRDGKWRSYINKPEVPTGFDFNADTILSAFTVSPGGKRRRFNTVVANFFNPAANWEADKLPWRVEEFFQQDNATELKMSLNFPFTTEWWRVHMLALMALNESRYGKIVTFNSSLAALVVTAGDVVTLTHKGAGWNKKPFRAVKLDNNPDGTVGVVLQEYEPAVYDLFKPALLSRAPRSTLPDLLNPPMPSYLTVKSGANYAQVLGDGTVLPRMFVTYGPVPFAEKYQVQYRRFDAGTWEQVEAPGNELFVNGVKANERYHVRVRGVTGIGSTSDWREADGGVQVAPPERPPNVAGLVFTQQEDGTRQYDWPLLSDLSVAGYEVRYYRGQALDWAVMTPMARGLLTSSPWENNLLPAATYTFAIKAINRFGQESEDAFFTTGDLADNRFGGGVVVLQPAMDGWPGTKTNCEVDDLGFALVASGTDDWADIESGTWDDWDSWSQSPASTIAYEHTVYDLGSVITVSIDSQHASTDSAVVEVSISDDDVSYSAWHAIAGNETCRYLKMRINVTQAGAAPASLQAWTLTIKEQ